MNYLKTIRFTAVILGARYNNLQNTHVGLSFNLITQINELLDPVAFSKFQTQLKDRRLRFQLTTLIRFPSSQDCNWQVKRRVIYF